MCVFALGLNHHTAPVDLRGRFAFPADALSPVLREFRAHLPDALPEAAILSTCNRTELYVAGHGTEGQALIQPALAWLAGRGGIASDDLARHTYVREGSETARHAFRVASGLDSMVLGEPQILGQMKQAVRGANEAGTLGTTLHQLFQRSFSVAKDVRTSTEIGVHSISMAAASVRLAVQLFEDLRQVKVLFVGAGDMIELVATHFAAKEPKLMAVANRTLDRGERLASRFGPQALRLADVPSRLHEFDVVISCTASTLPIIGLGAVESALRQRRRRPMFMVDLAVPRDIEPEVSRLSDIYLYTVDDLTAAVQTAGEKRLAAVEEAETIIDAGVASFSHWLDQRATVPLTIAAAWEADEWRAIEVARAHKLLARGSDIETVLDALGRGLTQKLLHGAMAELHASEGAQRVATTDMVSRLFLRHAAKRPGEESGSGH